MQIRTRCAKAVQNGAKLCKLVTDYAKPFKAVQSSANQCSAVQPVKARLAGGADPHHPE
jgi:hypothetical protein